MSLLRLDKIIEDVTGLGNIGIGQLRNIEYGKNFLWEISFKNNPFAPPKPFNDFFPAIDVNLDVAVLQNFQYEQYMSTYEVPHKTGLRNMSITFNDDEASTLLRYFSDWMNIDILNHGHFISALQDDHNIVEINNPDIAGFDSFGNKRIVYPIRNISLKMLTSSRNKSYIKSFDVIPNSTLSLRRDQTSTAVSYTMGFTIIREADTANADPTSFLDNLRNTALQFVSRFI
jgi:hypothetical protein